jgi:hypothetical protein
MLKMWTPCESILLLLLLLLVLQTWLQASLPDSLAAIASSSVLFKRFMQRAAAQFKQQWQTELAQKLAQQLRPSELQSLLANGSPGDDLVDWALHQLLQLELLEMQPVDTGLVLQLLQLAERGLLRYFNNQQQQQQQQQQPQQTLQMLQQVRCMLDGFTALQRGMAAHPAGVRSKARFAQREQQQLRTGWESFTLDWDICLGEESHAASWTVDTHLLFSDRCAHLGGNRACGATLYVYTLRVDGDYCTSINTAAVVC